jgi:hypothetical protein
VQRIKDQKNNKIFSQSKYSEVIEMKKKPVKKKVVRKKTVKKLETSHPLNPAIGKMKQEVLKKNQKFKIDYFGEESESIKNDTL